MCKLLRNFSALLILPLVLAVGCKSSSTTVTQPLAPGYSSLADETMGQTLQAAKSFYQSIQVDIQAGKYTPTPAEKTTLQTFSVTLNVALEEYLAFHQGLASQADAQAAVDKVTAAQSELQSIVPAKPTSQKQEPPQPDTSLTRS